MIITYLIYDTPSLLACSLICYPWHIAANPQLHRTLTIKATPWEDRKLMWLQRFRHMDKHGLLPLVKKLQIHEMCFVKITIIPPRRPPFGLPIRYPRFTVTNVQEFEMDYPDIPWLMPRVQRGFGQFLPTLRSLSLRDPKGSCRQILYFIGCFQNLEDLKLLFGPDLQKGPVDDLTLVPRFAPPLRGRLTMTSIGRAGLLKEMVCLFGGIRFRHMDLFNVVGMQLLLGACAETLETLRLYPIGGQLPLKCTQISANRFAGGSTLQEFDLSKNKSLRTLEVAASSIGGTLSAKSPDGAASRLLKHALSTITSPAFSEVTVVYRDYDFCGVESEQYPNWPAGREEEALQHSSQFEVFREMRKMRDFRLVLCADVWHRVGEHPVQVLKEAVVAEKARRGFDLCFPEPSVVWYQQESRTGLSEELYSVRPRTPWPERWGHRNFLGSSSSQAIYEQQVPGFIPPRNTFY